MRMLKAFISSISSLSSTLFLLSHLGLDVYLCLSVFSERERERGKKCYLQYLGSVEPASYRFKVQLQGMKFFSVDHAVFLNEFLIRYVRVKILQDSFLWISLIFLPYLHQVWDWVTNFFSISRWHMFHRNVDTHLLANFAFHVPILCIWYSSCLQSTKTYIFFNVPCKH